MMGSLLTLLMPWLPLQLRKLGSKYPVPLILANYDGVYDGEKETGREREI